MMSMKRLHDNKDKLPFLHKHICHEDKYGQPMTYDELQSFSVQALFDEFRFCGNNPHEIIGDAANEIDSRPLNLGNRQKFIDILGLV